jgi:hypothetical protein
MKKSETLEILNKLKERIPKLTTFFILLVLTVFVMYTILPSVGFFRQTRIFGMFILYDLLRIILPGLTIYIIIEIFRQIGPILDEITDLFVYSLPGIRRLERVSIRRILSDFTYIIIAILFNSTLSPFMTQISSFTGTVFNILFLTVILFLIYDIVKIGSTMLEEHIRKLEKDRQTMIEKRRKARSKNKKSKK